MKMLVIVLEDLGAFQHRTNLEHLSWNGIHHSLASRLVIPKPVGQRYKRARAGLHLDEFSIPCCYKYVFLDDPRLQLVTTELDRLGGAVLMHR